MQAHESGMPDRVLRRRFHLSRSEFEDIVGRHDPVAEPQECGY